MIHPRRSSTYLEKFTHCLGDVVRPECARTREEETLLSLSLRRLAACEFPRFHPMALADLTIAKRRTRRLSTTNECTARAINEDERCGRSRFLTLGDCFFIGRSILHTTPPGASRRYRGAFRRLDPTASHFIINDTLDQGQLCQALALFLLRAV